ncbi:MAG: hypothetical protein ABW252_15690 [Polyangiales bacterium]
MRNPDVRSALVALTLALGAGCAHPVVVRAPVLYPARIPVRAYPEVWVVGGALPEGDLGARLAAHLGQDGARSVKRVDIAQLQPLHEAGSIPPLSLVVVLEAGLDSEVRQGFDNVPVQYCDFYWGCYTQYQSVYSEVPVIEGEVQLTVYEGPTAAVLQTERFVASAVAENDDKVRKQVVDELGKQLERAIDVLKSDVRVQLEPVDALPLVTAALAKIRAGAWVEGRDLLEQAKAQLGGKKPEVQARVWYDLGIARWHAGGPDGPSQPTFESAKRALSVAIERGGERYRPALESLTRARERQAVLEEQRGAAQYNFSLRGAGQGAAPKPPATGDSAAPR